MHNFHAGLLVPLFGIFMIIAIVFIRSYFRTNERKEMHLTMRKAIESGQTLPQEFIDNIKTAPQNQKSPVSDVRLGIIFMAIAGGLVTWDYVGDFDTHGGLTGLAAIPGFIGIAFFLLGLVGLMTSKSGR